jgi:hypothetical protein
MQITFTTMKYRDKNYISFGTCFVLMLPIIVFTALLTYCLSGTFHAKPWDVEQTPRTALKDDDNLPIDTPEFQTGDEALFNFTGDTVLVLNQQDLLTSDEVRVLYKTPQGSFQTVDLPDNWLVKVNADTVPAKPPALLNDKLEQYRKAVAK